MKLHLIERKALIKTEEVDILTIQVKGLPMQIPISLWDISLLLALIALILLITVEIFIPLLGQTKLLVNQKRLKKIAIASGVSFMFFVTITIILNNPMTS